MVALSLGRGLRRKVGEPAEVATAPGAHVAASRAAAEPAPPSTAPHGTANVAPSGPRAPAVEDPRIEQARQLVAAGQSPKAIELLDQLHAEKPADADAPYLLATIYFDQRRWSEGLGAAQTAVRLNPELKTDGDLIRGAIRSLVSDRGYQRAQTFLRSLGAPALPFIKEAARRDPNPRVRQRAVGAPGRRSGRQFGSSSWSGGGRQASSSVFKR